MAKPKRPHLAQVEQVKSSFFPLAGGEDLVSPALSVSPGALLFSLNYEPGLVYGYRRIDGIERCDGRPRPSDATYYTLGFDGGSQDFGVGDVVTGATSGATGEVLVCTLTSGAWGSSTAAGTLVLFNVVSGTGPFQNNEVITATGGAAVVNGTATLRGATNDTDDATWIHAAIAATRADIQAVPGAGTVYEWMFGGVKYAFRDNSAGPPATASVMYKSTASGWSAVDMGKILSFTSGGTYVVAVGNVITGETGGAIATVTGVVVTSGTWAGGDAAGYVTFASQTGAFQAETIKVGANLNVANIAGNSATQVLLPGGEYEFVNENFYGSTATRRMYWVDGKNKAFEFDGTTPIPITTGMTTDTPIHIIEHKKHLFLAFPRGSVQHSAPGTPLVWSVITGAEQIGTGDEISGFSSLPGGTLAVFNRNQTYILYGSAVSGSDPWDLKLHASDSGAIEWSIQSIGTPRYLDDRGMTKLEAVQSFGDFAGATFSQKIQPLIDAKLKAGATVTASVRVRTKDQYRIFFSDGTGLIAKFRHGEKGEAVEFTRINYGITILSACSCEDSTGREVLLCGSSNGYVYEMDAGTSFDGSEIVAYLRLPFGHLKTPQVNKGFFKAILEIDAPLGCALQFTQEYNYGNSEVPRGITQSLDIDSGGGFWGISEWSEFIWGQQITGTAEGDLDGSGTNIGMFIRSAATYETPHTINGVNLLYSLRGLSR